MDASHPESKHSCCSIPFRKFRSSLAIYLSVPWACSLLPSNPKIGQYRYRPSSQKKSMRILNNWYIVCLSNTLAKLFDMILDMPMSKSVLIRCVESSRSASSRWSLFSVLVIIRLHRIHESEFPIRIENAMQNSNWVRLFGIYPCDPPAFNAWWRKCSNAVIPSPPVSRTGVTAFHTHISGCISLQCWRIGRKIYWPSDINWLTGSQNS